LAKFAASSRRDGTAAARSEPAAGAVCLRCFVPDNTAFVCCAASFTIAYTVQMHGVK